MNFKVIAVPNAVWFALLVGMTSTAWAQGISGNLDWKESEVPLPPAVDFNHLITFNVSSASSFVYAVDPASLSISRSDSLVRYVVVATNASGARNVLYEAIRCSTGEFKTYARYSLDGQWKPIANAQWRSMYERIPSKHALEFSKAGACDVAAPVGSVRELVGKLKQLNNYQDQ